MTPRRSRRSVLLVAAALLLLLGGTAAWLAVSATDGAAPPPNGGPQPAVRARSRAAAPHVSPDTTRADGAAAAHDDADPDWYARLRRRLAAGGVSAADRHRILDDAGKGKAPGGGLHAVLRRATDALAAAKDPAERAQAEESIDWILEEALRPYREDRARFAAVYREVRFGDGRLDRPGGSLVREFRFDEAALRILELIPELQTSCYEALAWEVSRAFVRHQAAWEWFRQVRVSGGGEPPPEFGSGPPGTLTPSAIFDLHVKPHLGDAPGPLAVGVAALFADLGEPEAAAACLERLGHLDRTSVWIRGVGPLASLDAEIAALRALRDVTAHEIPASASEPSRLAAWFETHRTSDLAHAIDGDGPVAIGAWDYEMTQAFLVGGLPWAPEQWQAARSRREAARRHSHLGRSGWLVESPQWRVFTDVSADFAAQATLVLESAWILAQSGLGLEAVADRRIPALVYARRSDYMLTASDRSGGRWTGRDGAVHTFLDDPDRTDFPGFHYPTLVHEATHAVVSWSASREPPSWFHEGLATYIERWDPTRSVASNEAATAGWVRRPDVLRTARDGEYLLGFDELVRIAGPWDVDGFGPRTLARYAAAESLLVSMSDDPDFHELIDACLAAYARREEVPAEFLDPRRAPLVRDWDALVTSLCERR